MQQTADSIRVMIVDDSRLTLAWTQNELEQLGYTVKAINDVWISSPINNFRPDVVLMDVNLGAMDGARATEILKRHETGRSTRILLHSARPRTELAQLATASGADGFIQKTDDPAVLDAEIRRALRPAGARLSQVPGPV